MLVVVRECVVCINVCSYFLNRDYDMKVILQRAVMNKKKKRFIHTLWFVF